MNNDIKEILDKLQNHLEKYEESFKNGLINSTTYYLYCDDARTLLDYITNLQEENKELKSLYDTPKKDKKIEKIGKDTINNNSVVENEFILQTKIDEIIDRLNGEDNE